MEQYLLEICLDADCQAKFKFETLDQLEKAQRTARALAKRVVGNRYFYRGLHDYATVLYSCARIMARM